MVVLKRKGAGPNKGPVIPKNKEQVTQGYEIKLQYFKTGGKYYTEGSYITTKATMYEVFEEIKEMQRDAKLPGIGGNEWYIYVNADNHPNGFPALIKPAEETWYIDLTDDDIPF